MNGAKQKRACISFITSVALLLGGCWGQSWPHRTVIIDLSLAHASVVGIAETSGEYLQSHGFTRMGKAGYDQINGTTTVFDYQGPDKLIVSIGPEGTRDFSKTKAVSIRFNQDRKDFSPESQRIFDDLVLALKKKWPDAVTVEPINTHVVAKQNQ